MGQISPKNCRREVTNPCYKSIIPAATFPGVISLEVPSAPQVVLMIKNLPTNTGDIRDTGSIPGSERSPGEGGLPGQSHGQRKLVGYSP